MAAGRLPKPGTEYGPCVDEKCGHIDCTETRSMANFICNYCKKPIGYERGFYILAMDGDPKSRDRELVHSSCYQDFIEEGLKMAKEILNIGAEKGE